MKKTLETIDSKLRKKTDNMKYFWKLKRKTKKRTKHPRSLKKLSEFICKNGKHQSLIYIKTPNNN